MAAVAVAGAGSLTSLYRLAGSPCRTGGSLTFVLAWPAFRSRTIGKVGSESSTRLAGPAALQGSTAGELIIGHPEIVGKQPRRELAKI